MRKRNKIVLISAITLILVSCSKVPITGRKQLKLLPNSTLNEMGRSNYAAFLKENPAVNPPTKASAEVTEVGLRISKAVEKFMSDNGLSSKLDGYKWEFNVVESPEINAWCMPGGKVVVYTGILPLTKDKDGLAVVMGHEIAHAIAEHGNERMSQQLAVQAAGVGLDVYMQQQKEQTRDIFMSAFGIGSQLGMLGYSRKHELEADKLGLVFMAMAGYNPERALSFWQEMSKAGGAKPPAIMSTHPSDETRIAEIKAFLPEAKKYYAASNESQKSTNSEPAGPEKKATGSPNARKLGVTINK